MIKVVSVKINKLRGEKPKQEEPPKPIQEKKGNIGDFIVPQKN
jgi:hypothetical protein